MESIKLTASGTSENSVIVGEGEFFHVPVGALTRFEAVVYVNNVRAQVVDSKWQVKGPQIVGNTVVQNIQTGTGVIQHDPTINGGYDGRPELIATSWIGGNQVYRIQVDGGAYCGRQFVRFTIHAQVQIHCPSAKEFFANCGQVTFDEKKMRVPFGGRLEYTTDDITVGGGIGVLQTVSGYRSRRNLYPKRLQTRGSENQFLDIGEDLKLFYRSEVSKFHGLLTFDDSPEELCWDEKNFDSYSIGYPPSFTKPSYESFITSFAYQAPVRGPIVESYIVISTFIQWGWQMVAVFNPDEGGWGAEPQFSREYSKRFQQDWLLPVWHGNSIDKKEWRGENLESIG